MIDSGSACHGCPTQFSEKSEKVTGPKLLLKNANGGPVEHYGARKVYILTGDGSHAAIRFQVLNITKPLLSVSELNDAGTDVHFSSKGSYTHEGNTKQTLVKRNGTFRMKAYFKKNQERNSRPKDMMPVTSEPREGPVEVGEAAPQEERTMRVSASADQVNPVSKETPIAPTQEERAKHEITHLPPRPCCDLCVSARGDSERSPSASTTR